MIDEIIAVLQQHYQEMGYVTTCDRGSLIIVVGERDDGSSHTQLKLGISIVDDYLLIWPIARLREVADPYNMVGAPNRLYSCRLPLADPNSITELDEVLAYYTAEANKPTN